MSIKKIIVVAFVVILGLSFSLGAFAKDHISFLAPVELSRSDMSVRFFPVTADITLYGETYQCTDGLRDYEAEAQDAVYTYSYNCGGISGQRNLMVRIDDLVGRNMYSVYFTNPKTGRTTILDWVTLGNGRVTAGIKASGKDIDEAFDRYNTLVEMLTNS